MILLQNFHSGFALQNEAHFFEDLYEVNDYTVVGFSYGAIKAFESVLQNSKRIDKLILISPAFFQTKDDVFKKLQLRAYKSRSHKYLQNFMKSCFAPYALEEVDEGDHSYEALEELLYYVWDLEKVERLLQKGIALEVHLGLSDAIIDVTGAREFFTPLSTVYTYQNRNHFLQGE